uniref:Copper transport protein n=1 Tax=Panagrolaimus sp. JU765 TaxID=591449 RepID=A0AC34Q8D6_9BILA
MDHSGHGHDHGSHVDHSGHVGHENHGENAANLVTTTIGTIIDKIVENITEIPKKLVEHDHSNHHQHDSHINSMEMDHTNYMDHTNHMDHSEHSMKMYFHGGNTEIILFDCWRINSFFGLLFSCFIIFLMGAAYEGIKWFRIYLQLKETKKETLKKRTCTPTIGLSVQQEKIAISMPSQSESLLYPKNQDDTQVYVTTVKESDTDVGSVGFFDFQKIRANAMAKNRLVQAGLYCIQITLAYFLMLIAMTYNVYLTAAVVLGAGFGHWIFALIQDSTTEKNPETVDAVSSDACH